MAVISWLVVIVCRQVRWSEVDLDGFDGVAGLLGFEGWEGFDGLLGVEGLEGFDGLLGVEGLDGFDGVPAAGSITL